MSSIELDQAKRALDRAIATFENEKKQLVRPDGTPKYAPAEHQERLAQLLLPVQKAAEQGLLSEPLSDL